jgi:hypothetical protein
MTRSISWCILISIAAVVIVCAVYNPSILSDKNDFLHHFVNQELLALLGIIMTITLASAANLHLEFNKIEERHKRAGLIETRRGVKQGAYCLIILFAISVAVVVTKPLFHESESMQTIFNGTALVVLIWNVLILLELTQLAFAIKPEFREDR